ncbi:MAG: DUF2946 domain-containing protein [Methylotenera sp.]|nr:DUF2946 domain-containing protein [Methylotenera sp.]
MMFFRRYQSVISKIILTVMVFASLAPAISHALASVTGNKSFTQKICTTNGTKVVIQVKTSMGQQLSTQLTIKPDLKNLADSQTAENHFEHCPFCANPQTAYTLPSLNALIVQTLDAQAQAIAEQAVPNVVFRPYLTPPSQAPPHISNI